MTRTPLPVRDPSAPSVPVRRRRAVSVSANDSLWETIGATSKEAKWVLCLSVGYLGLLGVLWLALREVSESWWVTAALTYLPRQPYLIPALVLGVAAWKTHRPSMLVNLLSVGWVLGPVMGLNLPVKAMLGGEPDGTPIRVVSCNVQGFEPDFSLVQNEIIARDPDLLLLQEVYGESVPLPSTMRGWTVLRHDEYVLASRYPAKQLKVHRGPRFDRDIAVAYEVQHPERTLLVFNIHLATARHGFGELDAESVSDGSGGEVVETYSMLRSEEAESIRRFLTSFDLTQPHILAGDFNVPSSSRLYKVNFGDYENAFDAVGVGYGYTSPCAPMSLWPANTPWLRIDHILPSDDFGIAECNTGSTAGSDHRLIFAELMLQEPAPPSPFDLDPTATPIETEDANEEPADIEPTGGELASAAAAEPAPSSEPTPLPRSVFEPLPLSTEPQTNLIPTGPKLFP